VSLPHHEKKNSQTKKPTLLCLEHTIMIFSLVNHIDGDGKNIQFTELCKQDNKPSICSIKNAMKKKKKKKKKETPGSMCYLSQCTVG